VLPDNTREKEGVTREIPKRATFAKNLYQIEECYRGCLKEEWTTVEWTVCATALRGKRRGYGQRRKKGRSRASLI